MLWEAQFGDFANNAQVIIDQFIASAEDKWRRLSGLTLLLPHGYEGQGPEHSSARVERFLQLAAEDNLQICQPSTAVQYFHVLRRQALTVWRTPLVIFTPKSLLRHSWSSSPISAFAQKRFLRVLADREVSVDARRVLLCTGKIVHELRAERARRRDDQTAIVSVEQLVPFPSRELSAEFARYSNAKDFVWVQEEPANMGARAFMMPRLRRLLDGQACVRCGAQRLPARPRVRRKLTTSNSRRCSRWRSEVMAHITLSPGSTVSTSGEPRRIYRNSVTLPVCARPRTRRAAQDETHRRAATEDATVRVGRFHRGVFLFRVDWRSFACWRWATNTARTSTSNAFNSSLCAFGIRVLSIASITCW